MYQSEFYSIFRLEGSKTPELAVKVHRNGKSSMVLKHQVNVENLKATALVIKIASNKKP